METEAEESMVGNLEVSASVMLRARHLVSLILGAWASVSATDPSPAAGQPVSLDPDRGYVFTGASAAVLGGSFFSPRGLGATWDPTAAEISQVERALTEELRHRLGQNSGVTAEGPQVRDYYRQYAGIYLNGQKLIFVNGFHQSHVEYTRRWLSQPRRESELSAFPVGARGEDFWHVVPVHVDDGGDYYFQATYDPVGMRTVRFKFQGR